MNPEENPYEPPQAEVKAQPPSHRKPVALTCVLSVIGAGLSVFTWGGGIFGPILTAFLCLLGGWLVARCLHKSPGMIALGVIIYGLLIALTLLGIAFGACLVMMGNYH